MTDNEALRLMRLLAQYMRLYSEGEDMTVTELAEDLATSDTSGLDEIQDLNIEIKNLCQATIRTRQ
jgi:O-phosphoseryl-tRNA(Cys) synthetase